MTQISAADNHVIATKDGKWRLAYNDRPLAEGSERGFRYSARFGKTRRLPENGTVLADDILQVVLGWQSTDESWHLGLILAPDLAAARGSRWCEIVHWPDPDISVFQDLAQASGQQLAQAIGVPFYVIPPQVPAPSTPPRPLPKLPLRFGHWQMQAMPNQRGYFTIVRTNSWVRERISKMAWYGFWAMIYMFISLATLFGDIALPVTGTLLPNPQVLPYLGIGISIVLLFGIIMQLGILFLSIDRIVVDGARGVVSAWNRKTMKWHVEKVELQSVYVSEVVKRREKSPTTEYGELNLHLGGGKFHFVLQHETPESNDDIPQPEHQLSASDGVQELTREIVQTNLQAAALYIAETVGGVPVWYDSRVR